MGVLASLERGVLVVEAEVQVVVVPSQGPRPVFRMKSLVPLVVAEVLAGVVGLRELEVKVVGACLTSSSSMATQRSAVI